MSVWPLRDSILYTGLSSGLYGVYSYKMLGLSELESYAIGGAVTLVRIAVDTFRYQPFKGNAGRLAHYTVISFMMSLVGFANHQFQGNHLLFAALIGLTIGLLSEPS